MVGRSGKYIAGVLAGASGGLVNSARARSVSNAIMPLLLRTWNRQRAPRVEAPKLCCEGMRFARTGRTHEGRCHADSMCGNRWLETEASLVLGSSLLRLASVRQP